MKFYRGLLISVAASMPFWAALAWLVWRVMQ